MYEADVWFLIDGVHQLIDEQMQSILSAELCLLSELLSVGSRRYAEQCWFVPITYFRRLIKW